LLVVVVVVVVIEFVYLAAGPAPRRDDVEHCCADRKGQCNRKHDSPRIAVSKPSGSARFGAPAVTGTFAETGSTTTVFLVCANATDVPSVQHGYLTTVTLF